MWKERESRVGPVARLGSIKWREKSSSSRLSQSWMASDELFELHCYGIRFFETRSFKLGSSSSPSASSSDLLASISVLSRNCRISSSRAGVASSSGVVSDRKREGPPRRRGPGVAEVDGPRDAEGLAESEGISLSCRTSTGTSGAPLANSDGARAGYGSTLVNSVLA